MVFPTKMSYNRTAWIKSIHKLHDSIRPVFTCTLLGGSVSLVRFTVIYVEIDVGPLFLISSSFFFWTSCCNNNNNNLYCINRKQPAPLFSIYYLYLFSTYLIDRCLCFSCSFRQIMWSLSQDLNWVSNVGVRPVKPHLSPVLLRLSVSSFQSCPCFVFFLADREYLLAAGLSPWSLKYNLLWNLINPDFDCCI